MRRGSTSCAGQHELRRSAQAEVKAARRASEAEVWRQVEAARRAAQAEAEAVRAIFATEGRCS